MKRRIWHADCACWPWALLWSCRLRWDWPTRRRWVSWRRGSASACVGLSVWRCFVDCPLLQDERVHDYEVEEEWSGTFIVLGTTGSGKTTLIK